MFDSIRRRLPRVGRWPRLCAAGICALLAVSSALGAKRDPAANGATTPVVVAQRSLPAGHQLTVRDLALRQWPARLRPGAARASPGELIGRRLAGPVGAHEPITTTRLLGHDLTTGLDADTVVAPVTLDDPHLADLVHAGDRVDLLATDRAPDSAEPARSTPVTTVASRALVLAVLSGSPDALSSDTTELILAVPRGTATRITRVRSSQTFAVLGDSP